MTYQKLSTNELHEYKAGGAGDAIKGFTKKTLPGAVGWAIWDNKDQLVDGYKKGWSQDTGLEG